LQKIVKEHIDKVLKDDIGLEKPKDRTLGHFSTPYAFSLAKILKKSPLIIAEELADKFSSNNNDIFEKVSVVKGFVNFTLSLNFLEDQANQALKEKENFAKRPSKNKSILLEFVSANPTGPLHIGHARGAILGQALARLGTYLGYNITKEYYVNDAGSQMDLLYTSLDLAVQEFIFHKTPNYPQTYYRGEYLEDIGNKVLEKFGKDAFLDKQNKEKISSFAKDEVLVLIKKDLKNLGVEFDNFVYEKPLYKTWNETKAKLEKSGHLYEKDSKIYLKSSDFGDDSDRVVVRDNGVPTYLAGDIIYHENKFKRNFDTFINIWGADHHGYMKRVKASIEFLGYDSSKLEIILSQMVALLQGGKPYKMSKRLGNVILLSDITKEVGADALKFIFLTKKSDTHLEFDLVELKKQDSSNPIFYISYAYARICQIFKKANLDKSATLEYSLNNAKPEAFDLVYEALLLPSVLELAFAKRDMQKISEYLYSLASSLHHFYNEGKIVGASTEKGDLKALSLVALSIKVGLGIFGIIPKESMEERA